MKDTDSDYYQHIRKELEPLFGNARDLIVLEVGCGSGYTGAYLKERGIARTVVGVEQTPAPAEEAENYLDRVILGDIESLPVQELGREFDAILLADVLEHLYDPWQTLIRLSHLLVNGGIIVASIPNVRCWRVTYDLIFHGRWQYTNFGILDRTHIRFFTKSGIYQLFENASLGIEFCTHEPIGGKSGVFNKLTFGLFEDHFIRQYFVRARKGKK